MLRMVPLPRFTGEDEAAATCNALIPPMPRKGVRKDARLSTGFGGGGGGPAEGRWRGRLPG
jgi:hypothetical protein